MDFKDRIRSRRIELGMTLDEVAKKVGVNNATISRWESGAIENQRRDKIELLAAALKLSPGELMGWDDALPSNITPMPSTHRVPRVGSIACGVPILAEENIECYDAVPDYVKADFTLVCKGDSMINARIFDGDIVCIRQQPEVANGEIAAVLVDDSATLKRVRLFKDHISLVADNPTFPTLEYWGEDMAKVRILGKATHFISTVK